MKKLSSTLLFLPACASAHIESDPWLGWNWDAWLLVSLSLAASFYAIGISRLARAADSRLLKWRAASFFAGLVALVIALLSPLDSMGNQLFSAHMLQHEILMLIAAPLIAIGKPLAIFAWGLPTKWRSKVARPFQARAWKTIWESLTAPLTAWGLHAIVLWGWHAPALFEASLRNEAIHILQHASFFLSALLLWWALIKTRSAAALYLLTTMIHTGVLGALLTFAPLVLYPAYLASSVDALEDQQLGGLIMWVPAGFILLVAGLTFLWRVLPRTTEP